MNIVGIICEYNPFHNGHIYHLSKVKEQFPNSLIVLVMSGNFTERGLPSILNKWDKAEISLQYGVDLVVELPFCFATQSADIFAKGAIQLLNALKVEYLVFGSESNSTAKLQELASIINNNQDYEEKVKLYLDQGNNYPTSLNKALQDIANYSINSPNDLLGFSYIKEIAKQQTSITPITIQRTNKYHDTTLGKAGISSATSIRQAFIQNKDWQKEVPPETIHYMKNSLFLLENYFPFLKYKITTSDDLSIYQTVDEGMGNKIKKEINNVTTVEELIKKIKSKRYTYNRICRMLIHILCDFTKEKAASCKNISYIRILGFSKKGRSYLNKIKKETILPIITTFSKSSDPMLAFEMKTTCVYASILPENEKNKCIKQEYQTKPKMKE